MSLKRLLEEATARFSEKTAIVSGNRRLSYAYLDEASNRVANALTAMGVKKGDRVTTLLNNSPEFAVIYFGITKIGAIAVPLDTKYTVYELTALFKDSLPEVLVSENPVLETLMPALPDFKSIRHVIDLSPESDGPFTSYREIIATSPAQRTGTEPEPDDLALIAYTSGPSLHPRGAMLLHGNLVKEATISASGFEQTEQDIMMLYALPMHHMFGLVAVLLGSLYKGSTVVMVPGTGLSISTFIETIARERGTMFMGVPFIFGLAADLAENEGINSDLSSLRLCASAGAPLPLATARRFKQYYGFDLIDFWGLTEATCHCTCSPTDGSGKPGSIGKTLPGWEVKIADDNGRELPPGQTGELIARGPMMGGYYHNPEATARIIKDGWLHSGDIGRLDEDDYLFLTGRKKETIIVKGQNISPQDIEGILQMHPGVAEAAVIGIPDQMRGEVIEAVVSPKKGESVSEQDIKQFCLERIASYKVPKQVIFLSSLPKDSAGRINRKAIRNQLSIPPLFLDNNSLIRQ